MKITFNSKSFLFKTIVFNIPDWCYCPLRCIIYCISRVCLWDLSMEWRTTIVFNIPDWCYCPLRCIIYCISQVCLWDLSMGWRTPCSPINIFWFTLKKNIFWFTKKTVGYLDPHFSDLLNVKSGVEAGRGNINCQLHYWTTFQLLCTGVYM
jgi:hypothetical protein